MFINNTSHMPYSLSGVKTHEIQNLMPGWNEVPAHIWQHNEQNYFLQGLLKSGTLVIVTNEVFESEYRNKVTLNR